MHTNTAGLELARILIRRKLTLYELATKSNVPRVTLSRVLNGRTNPQLLTKVKLADALGCKPSEIWPESEARR